MKKLALFSLMLLSCSIFKPCDYHYEWKCREIFSNPEEAMRWVFENIKNKEEKADYWKTPKETHASRKGDCEDQAFLFMNFLAENIRYRSYDCKAILIEQKKDYNHMIVFCEGKYYDPTKNILKDKILDIPKYKKTVREYEYQEAMWYAETYHKDPLL